MFDISTVILDNFRSFKGRHTWVLPQDPGLCFLTGRNDDNPALIRNGAGKSTLLESIVWCLYDKTSRGLKATDIVTWGCKKASVTVKGILANEPFEITRTRNPNTLLLNGTVVDNEALVKFLRLSYDEFLYSVIFSQFNETFFDLGAAKKLALFSKIMKLDIWLEKSDLASKEAKSIEKIKNTLESNNSVLLGIQTATKQSIEELKERALNWDADKEKKLKKITDDADRENWSVSFNEVQIEDVKKSLAKIEPKIEGLNKSIKDTRTEMEGLKEDINHLNIEIRSYQSDISTLDRNLKQLSGLDASCPTCLQQVDEKHLIEEKFKIDVKRNEIKATLSEFENDKKVLMEEWNLLNQREIDYNQKLKCQLDAERNFKLNLRSFEDKLRQAAFTVTRLQQEIKEIKASKNEYNRLLEAKVVEIGKVQDNIQSNQSKLDELNEQYEAVEYWVSGFKKLRLLVIEETLRSLEIEINNSLESLGLINWKIQFDIERENKSGGVTTGFVVFIQPPGQESVRWESYSGGETQLLRLAGALGLSNLIMERAGLNNLIELYDEPSSHVSNVNALVQTLHNRANNLGKKVILVDHSAIEYPFDSEVLVVKDENGSRIQ